MEVLSSNQPNLTLLICSITDIIWDIISSLYCCRLSEHDGVQQESSCYFGHFEDKEKVNLCTSFHSRSMFHFKNTEIWTSEFSQCVTPKPECCLVEKKSFLLIFGSMTVSSIRDKFMRKYASSQQKRKSFYRKSELQMFSLISRRPYWCTKTVQRCVKRFGKKLRNCGPQRSETWKNCLYISLL